MYRYGNEAHKDQVFHLLSQELMKEPVFEKRLNIAKIVLEFGTMPQMINMQEFLLTLAHSLTPEQLGQVLNVFENLGMEKTIHSILPDLAARTEYFESNPHLSLKFATILYKKGNDAERNLAYTVALQIFAKHFDILSAHLMNDPLSIYHNLAEDSVSYVLGAMTGYKGERTGGIRTPSEHALAQELIFNISVFNPLYALQNQKTLLPIITRLLKEASNTEQKFMIFKHFLRIADNGMGFDALTPLVAQARAFVEKHNRALHSLD